MSAIQSLEPHQVWELFDKISQVPRPSKHEEKILAWLEDFARQHGFAYDKDETGNLVIRKPASPGREHSPGVVLQSHVDMVCEKNRDVEFDFMTDSIQPRIDGEWVKASGTTLGADDGIGMAAALAVLVDDQLEHGPLEALFTVDEETGLTGAFGLGAEMLTGKYLINLDSEDEGEIFIGCAGGIDTLATFTYQLEPADPAAVGFKLTLTGLTGGHSGDDIHKGYGNSNKIINRFLWFADRSLGLRLATFEGGNLRNAIPREAFVEFTVPAKSEAELRAFYERYKTEIAEEFQYTERKLSFHLEPAILSEVMDLSTQRNLIRAIQSVPNGVLAMSRSIEGLVETSTNLASVKFGGDCSLVVTTSQRSSVESAKFDAMATVESVFLLAGASVAHSDGYPGWTPNPNSHLLQVAQQVYRSAFGSEAKVKAIHAGLECGLFLQKYPHLEMISIGPTLRGVHSPEERLEIKTVAQFWTLLTAILKEL